MEPPRLLRPDEWSIEDHPSGWNVRCMPWIPTVGPRAILVIIMAWIVTDRVRMYLQSTPIPIVVWFVAIGLSLFVQVLLYFACWNPNRYISATDGCVTCLAGTFPQGLLRSLRLRRSRRSRTRSLLVFTGTHIPEVELIGEPGLPDASASRLLQELASRVEHAATHTYQRPCEPDDAMDSRSPLLMNADSWAASH